MAAYGSKRGSSMALHSNSAPGGQIQFGDLPAHLINPTRLIKLRPSGLEPSFDGSAPKNL